MNTEHTYFNYNIVWLLYNLVWWVHIFFLICFYAWKKVWWKEYFALKMYGDDDESDRIRIIV